MKALSDYLMPQFTDEQQHKIFNLTLYATNTSELYRNHFLGLQKALYKKYLSGQFAEEQATKAFYNTIPRMLKAYEKEFGDKHRLSEAEKQALATELREHYTIDFELYPNGGYVDI